MTALQRHDAQSAIILVTTAAAAAARAMRMLLSARISQQRYSYRPKCSSHLALGT